MWKWRMLEFLNRAYYVPYFIYHTDFALKILHSGRPCVYWLRKIRCQSMVKVKNPIPPTRRPTRRSTHYRRVGQHTTDASANTLPTRWSTHYRRVGRHTTDTYFDTRPKVISFNWNNNNNFDTLPTRILTRYRNRYFFQLEQQLRHTTDTYFDTLPKSLFLSIGTTTSTHYRHVF